MGVQQSNNNVLWGYIWVEMFQYKYNQVKLFIQLNIWNYFFL